jgi:hypothetical protein
MNKQLARLVVATVTAVTAALSPAMTTTASASAGPVVEASWVVLPPGWQQLSSSELAARGFTPDLPSPDGQHVLVSATALPQVLPNSHSGCAGAVCIDVYGTGLYVSSWDTYAHLGTGNCGYAAFNVNGVTRQTGPTQCGNTSLVYATGTLVNHTYANNTVLCNTWPPNSSSACATVHS